MYFLFTGFCKYTDFLLNNIHWTTSIDKDTEVPCDTVAFCLFQRTSETYSTSMLGFGQLKVELRAFRDFWEKRLLLWSGKPHWK